MKALLGVLLGIGLISGCQSGSDDDEAAKNWLCGEFGSVCSCDALRPDTDGDNSNPVDRCEFYDCCMLSDVQTEFSLATCECLNAGGSCQAEAESRGGARIVSQCPPEEDQAPVACAKNGENCRPSYLSDRGLEGCCEGTLCKPNEDGVPVCSTATAEELARDRECRRVGSHPSQQSLEVLDALATTAGELVLESEKSPLFSFGDGGCLNDVRLTLSHADQSQCGLLIGAGPDRDADGKLIITDAALTGSGCPGIGDALIDPSSVQGTLSFQTATCGGPLVIESYCAAGEFELQLHAEAVQLPSNNRVTFNGNPVRLRGGACGTPVPGATCD